MPLTSRVFLNPEARAARAQSFYAGAQQRKLAKATLAEAATLPRTGEPSASPNSASTTGGAESPPAATAADGLLNPTHAADKGLRTAMTEPELPAATKVGAAPTPASPIAGPDDLEYLQYSHDLEARYLPEIRALISKDLSEPYSIYVYRYFLYQWGHLCFMALDPATSALVGVVVCKLEPHASHSPATFRGYIAMLAVSSIHRGKGIATKLVRLAIDAMAEQRADEIVLETEETNIAAMRLYERLGFLRSKKLHRYYLNGNSAYRLVLSLRGAGDDDSAMMEEMAPFPAMPPPASETE